MRFISDRLAAFTDREGGLELPPLPRVPQRGPMKLLIADGLSTCALRLKRGGDRRRTGTAIRGTEGAIIAGPLRRNIHEVMHVCVLRRRCEVLGLAHRCHALVRSCFDVPLHGLWHFRLGRSGRTVSPWLLSFCPLPSSCCVGRSPSLKGGLVFSSTPQAPNARHEPRPEAGATKERTL